MKNITRVFVFLLLLLTLSAKAQHYKFPDITYLSKDTLFSVRDFHYPVRLSSTNIAENKIQFNIIHENFLKNTTVKRFYVKFTTQPFFKIYGKTYLNGSRSIAGYNPISFAKWSTDSTQLIFDILKEINPQSPRFIRFYLVPYLNGTGRVKAEFEYTDSNGKTRKVTIYSGEITSKRPDVKWFLEKKGKNKYCIAGKMIYNYDFIAYAPEKNNTYNLTINGKKITGRCFRLPKQTRSVVASGTIEHKEKNTVSTWPLNAETLFLGTKGKTRAATAKPGSKIENCNPVIVTATKKNNLVIIRWKDLGNPDNSAYQVFRRKINPETNTFYPKEKYKPVYGSTTSKNQMVDSLKNLPDSSYYIYYVKRENGNVYFPSQQPVFVHSPFVLSPYTRKYFYVETGIGLNIINKYATYIPYISMGFWKVNFNNYIYLIPLNLRLQSEFKDDIGFSAYPLINFRHKKFIYKLGGGLVGIYNKTESKINFGPEIEAQVTINPFKKTPLKGFGITLSGRYSQQCLVHNYSGIYLGVNYSF